MLSIQLLNIQFKSNRLTVFCVLVCFVATFSLMGCSETGVNADRTDSLEKERTKQGSSMLNSNAPFTVLNQGFNNNITPWVDKSVSGPGGWCGEIALSGQNISTVKPSAGKGYAYASNGQCNDHYSKLFFPSYTSGPASGPNPNLLSNKFPESGFVQELDIYLDPEYKSGVSTPIFDPAGSISLTGNEEVIFTYANSLCKVCELATFQPLYFAISVVKENDQLSVAGYEVDNEGWYTFRQVFESNDAGKLTVEFQLSKNGTLLHSKAIESTFLTKQPTHNFEASSLGSGYIWFVSIADNLKLPIDENRMRPGN